jgi:hypothetical protein
MKKKTGTLLSGVLMGLLITAPAFANSLPLTGGLYIANGSGSGVFYSFTYIAMNLQTVQQAVNNAGGMTNVYLDLQGQTTNFGQFITAGASAGISNTTFNTYAQSHPYTVPSGVTVYSQSQGQYSYSGSTTSTSSVTPPAPPTLPTSTGTTTSTNTSTGTSSVTPPAPPTLPTSTGTTSTGTTSTSTSTSTSSVAPPAPPAVP